MAGFALSACGGARGVARIDRSARASESAAAEVTAGRPASNILRSDYAGSASCEPCHKDIHIAWSTSPMHRMTRDPALAEIRAPFDNRTFHFKRDSAELVQNGRDRFVSVVSPEFGNHIYRLTRVIGGRYREDFAGLEVAEAREGAPAVGDPRDELVLPVTYVYSPPSLRLKGYSVMVSQRPGLRAGGVWNRTCIFCHNTAPYFSSLFGALLGPKAPSYQGEVVDRLLPQERSASLVVVSPSELALAASREIDFLARRPALKDALQDVPRALEQAIVATQNGFGAADLVELGIGCESCHGGARAHTRDPTVKPSFEIESSFLRAAASPWETARHASAKVAAQNRTCARCHQVLFSRYPFTWEGGRRGGGDAREEAGGSHISSGEGRDFLLGGCSTALGCVACHDPHAEDSAEKLTALAGPKGNELCAGCHADERGDDKLAAHSHHRPGGAGAVCLNCHMPAKNMGLAYKLTRYHRIGSPTDRARVEADRPLECALCHADKTVGELVSAMERWWNKRYDRGRLTALYGDMKALPLPVTARSGKAHEQATALYVLGERPANGDVGAVASQLLNPYPLVRYYAREALGKIAGRPCEVNLEQDDAQIRVDLARWLSDSGLAATSSR